MNPEQNQTTNDSNYPDRPTPVVEVPSQPKRSFKGLVIIALLLLFLVVVTALALIGKHGNTSSSKAQCSGISCFNSRFTECTPSEYTDTNKGGSAHYVINQNGDLGCSVAITYIKANYSPGVTGKSMTCDLDNSQDVHTAIQNALYYPDDYSCTGELAGFFKEVNSIPAQP